MTKRTMSDAINESVDRAAEDVQGGSPYPITVNCGAVKWFGNPWGARICQPEDRVEAPVGKPCAHCERPIAAEGPQGQGLMICHAGDPYGYLPWHLDCFLMNVLGPGNRPREGGHNGK